MECAEQPLTMEETWHQIKEGNIKAEPWQEAFADFVYSCMMPKETPLFEGGGTPRKALPLTSVSTLLSVNF